MKINLFWLWRWRRIKYRNRKRFHFWSPQITGKGDETLAKDAPIHSWRRIIVLKPIGGNNNAFRIGYKDFLGNTKISNAERVIRQGPFGMRMGPQDCNFFIASNDGKVDLELGEYFDKDDEAISKLTVY